MITDPYDPRPFRRWLTFNVDGTVAAVHETEASVEQPETNQIEVTALAPVNVSAMTIAPSLVATLNSAVGAVTTQQAALDTARQAHSKAQRDIRAALTVAAKTM